MNDAAALNATIPKNSLVQGDTQATLLHCSNVIKFLSNALPSIDHAGGTLDAELSHGASWILDAVSDALDYEASKSSASKVAAA